MRTAVAAGLMIGLGAACGILWGYGGAGAFVIGAAAVPLSIWVEGG